jgi:pyruvate kinase
MMEASEIDGDFVRQASESKVPLWFDIKAMQMRVKEVICDETCDHLEFILNRPVKVNTPCAVWFKAGEDCGKCVEIRNGTHFIFEGGPNYEVRKGESIHIRNPELFVGGPVFLDYELEKIERVVSLGFKRFYLSYVYDQPHVDAFRNLIGPDAELILKIENQWGLDWIAEAWRPSPHTHLMAARGDLYIEVDYPHQIMNACKLVIEKDPSAYVGSRMLLSLVDQSVPSCADFSDLAWLYEIGYRRMLLCDELCLKDELLSRAVNAFDAFRKEYAQ